MTQREDALKFEQSRIKSLQEERLLIQKKTFTKWINSFLLKARMEVEDLFTDLADGKKLLKLLEIISGERLAKPNNGRMRVHKIENVNKSLAFLHTKVRLESIGAEDIVDGNPRLILGLIWTIILRFQIQEIEIDVDEENESSEKKSAKDALLLWCQRKTNGYPHVNIQDFTGSWRSGLGFNALIHAHRPDLIQWSELHQTRHIDNLNYAFDVANSELGIPRLLDAEDVDTQRPDEKSIMTYIASYYHTFARMKNEIKSGKRIANIVGQMMDADKMKVHYGKLTTDLLEWIKLKIGVLEDRNFPNSLEGIQRELLAFKQYRTIEKPPKYKERSEIEALFFNINTRLKSLNQPVFIPQEGQLVNDIERKWIELERAEHKREVALRSELLRQERLEQLNYKFERKSVLREGYLKEMIQVLSDPRYGSNLAQVDATVKKHEAISADIMAREERFHDLTNMSEELVRENYHGLERVKTREQQVLQRWKELLGLLDRHKMNLSALCALMSLMREIDTTSATVQELQLSFQSTEVGPHLLGVEDLLQRHSLQELQVNALGESQRRLQRQAAQVQSQVTAQEKQGAPALNKESGLLEAKLEQLNKAYSQLGEYSKERKARLEDARNFFQFLQDHEDEESWLVDRQRICRAGIIAKDLRALISLQQKHKALEDETKTRKPKSDQLSQAGRRLVAENHPSSAEIENRLESLQEHWRVLEELLGLRKKQLEEAGEALQFCADANEADSWMKEKMALVASEDYGEDEPSAQALLQRHKDLEGELNAYRGDLQSLNTQAEKLKSAGVSALQLDQTQTSKVEQAEPLAELEQDEWTQEVRLVPQDEWVDEIVERIEPRTVEEKRLVPQVRSLYPFSGQGMQMAKGEIMLLLNKTNPDWWSVRKADGTDGFVPASYVREIDPKVIQIQVRKPERVRVTQRVKKTRMVRQVVPVRRVKSTRSAVKPSVKRPAPSDAENLEKRMKKINDTYDQLQELATRRHALLEDSIRLYGFYRECDDFEKWIKDREKMLSADDSKDNVETAKRKYEKFLTDLSASGKRVEAIDAAVQDFVKQGHSQLDKVKARQRHIHKLWDHLNWLKAQKEKSLEGASSVELFNRTCDEAHDWMLEKITQLDTAEIGPDLKTVQALQRRHQHLERELAPVEEKVRKVNLLANSVKNTYPNELNNVNKRQNEVRDLWNQVQTKAMERRSRLQDAVGQQIFMSSSKNLISWATGTLDTMKDEEPVRDIATAERLKKQHAELGEEIKTKEDEFREVEALGSQLLSRNPSLTEVKDRYDKLRGLYDNVSSTWLSKQAWLEQCLELQQFNREADQIDATTSSHATFLEFADLGESLDDVEALLKQHEKFENTLLAQDDRLKAFSDVADKLIAQNHYDKNNINDKRNQVISRRAAVKDAAQRRRAALKASEYYQQFSAEVDDLRLWLGDKMKTASDETYRDLNNLERKLQKHEAFERELRANEGQLRAVNKAGKALISEENYRSEDVGIILKDLNEQWDELVIRSLEKGRRLRQAAAQHGYNRIIEDARQDLEEIENAMASDQVGKDLRSCKDLLKKHQLLETKLNQWEQKVNDLVTMGQEMAHEGHFDAPNILKTSQDTQKKFQGLKEPAKKRREALEESLRFHKFGFELDAELQWINDHLPQASSVMMGQNLHQTQSLFKKHKKFEAEVVGHEPMIMKTLASGQGLLDQAHPQKKKIQDLCDTLNDAWKNLLEKVEERTHALDLSLKAQEFFFEAGEVESWLVEKNDVLNSTDYGRDRDAATKLLTKHKALELELDTYNGIVTEMGNTASSMINSKHPDSKAIANKQQAIAQQVRSLQRLACVRQQRLMESMYRHEYFLESRELEQWIKEQEQTAASEDYGQDYEHLLLLQTKFNDFKHRIEAGSERFNQCQVLAKKLIANESPYIQDIEKRQEQLGESWQNLLKLVRNREQRLQAAGEIHRFHRDVAEALSRIQEKKVALPDDLGRDLNSVLSLIRKHEGFENDLVALEAQLQVLVEDSARLQALYPGNNAAHIDQQQKIVLANWEELKERSAHRRDQLQASCDLQRFLTQVRDLINWTAGLCATMSTQDNVRDAASAQLLKAEHDALKGEIEAREETFSSVLDLGEAMVQTGHYAATEVEEKCSQLLDERQKLHTAWQQKKIHLDQLIDLHFFLRDAKQLDNLSATQEAALSNDNFGVSVEEVDAQVKKHNEFEKLLSTQEDKLGALQEHGSKLLSQNHFETRTIAKRLDEVIQRRARIRELCNARKARLEAGLLHAQFVRDVGEAETWIGERQKKLEAEASKGQVSSLEDKIKKLQKHQAFQAELAANQSRIEEIKVKGEILLRKHHPASVEIRQQLDHLISSWRKLLAESENRGRGLEEAQDILDFNNQVEKIEAWIRDKEMMVQAGDTGKDYEHCLSLQRKLDDVDSDMRVDDARMKTINSLADKLIKQEKDEETKAIQQRRDLLNNKWRGLQGALGAYREKLAGALEIHLFNRDIDDTNQRVVEKSLAMNTSDVGKDLAGVEHLQRKQEAMERDMTAIEGKLKEHQTEAYKLSQKYPENASQINAILSELETNWNELQRLTSDRRKSLSQAYTLHKFRAELRELETWVADTIKRMNEVEPPATILEAEALLELHQERKAEIDGRQDTFKSLGEYGQKLIPMGENIQESLTHLGTLQNELNNAWHAGKQKLKQAHQLQLFKEQASQADSWLATKEAFLNNDDLGESLSGVEKLMRKHEDFEKMLTSQLGRIEELEKFAKVVLSEGHADAHIIESRLKAVCSRRDKLKSSALARRNKLVESRRLNQFLRNVLEVEGWLHEKQQVANDENYRESTNLQSKIQKHAAFESELAANKGRVSSVTSEGQALVKENHYASKEIQERLDDLEAEWELLQETSKLKKTRLDDAYQALLFSRTLDEFEAWIDEIETQLQSEDHGKDLSSVSHLLKRHTNLENDVMSHNEACESIKETAANFKRANHFMSEEIQERATTTINRYHGLQEPIQIRRDNLEDAKLLHQFARDVEDEMHWLSEKEVLAASKDLGSSLTTVQRLQKKHHALEAELISREPVVSSLASRATAMVRSGHFASEKIESLSRELQEKLMHLRDLASIRKLRLLDAVESQMFYAEAAEAEQWIKEKQPLLTSSDYGKDEDSVQSLFKKLEGVERDLCGFTSTVENLKKLSKGLIERHHFDSKNIAYKQSEIEHKFEDLQNLKEKRSQRLLESEKYHRFIQIADQVIEWIGDQTTIAASEDYGADVEHVELLIQMFENFMSSLISSENRMTGIIDAGQKLIEEKNPESGKIHMKIDETKQQWEDLRELAHARQEALAGAKQVHMFDRTADETISWIQEKEASLGSDHEYAHDLETIQALVRKHQGLDTDLKAVKEQVVSVLDEASRLASLFPDATEHIAVKHEQVDEAWSDLLQKAAQRKSKLVQAEQLQAYFDDYRDLISWINETIAKVTAPELARDVPGAEALISRHNEYRTEINAHDDAFSNFYKTGQTLVQQGHFLAKEIQEKVSVLKQRHQILEETWQQRKLIYEQNFDTQSFKRDAETLENWLLSREPMLKDEQLGESIPQVEELIMKHQDFEKTIEAQEEKFNALKRITLLEKAFQKQLETELAARQAEKERVEKARLEERKRKEVQRITEERKREEERRRYVESPRHGQRDDMNGNFDDHESSMNRSGSPMKSGASDTSHNTPTPTKSYGLHHMLSDKFRKSSNADIKRAESMKVDTKKPKRTPSFTTRRRTQSFRKHQRIENVDSLPPVEIQGVLERKHELQSGGKKAAVRSWKPYYTVLCGQLLCFFKDIDDFQCSKAATAPINIFNGTCEKAEDYTKRKNVFRLKCTDGSEFLFLSSNKQDMEDWVNKISFHAKLPPSLQLMSYDDSHKDGAQNLTPDHPDEALSSSSHASTPEMERKNSVIRRDVPPNSNKAKAEFQQQQQQQKQQQQLHQQLPNKQRFDPNRNSENLNRSPESQPQKEFLQMYMQQHPQHHMHHPMQQQARQHDQFINREQQFMMHPSDKPPIPPRGAPPPVPARSPSFENSMPMRRNDVDNYAPQARPQSYQPNSNMNLNGSSGQYANDGNWHRQLNQDHNIHHQPQEIVPPLPSTAPPSSNKIAHWNNPHDNAYGNLPANTRQMSGHQMNTFTGRPNSLPPYVAPPVASSPTSPPSISVVDGAGRRASESGSESEASFGGSRKDRDMKKSSVLSNLFGRRKKSSQ